MFNIFARVDVIHMRTLDEYDSFLKSQVTLNKKKYWFIWMKEVWQYPKLDGFPYLMVAERNIKSSCMWRVSHRVVTVWRNLK